jgi:DNA-binding NarL/FixJ family response regulator
MTRERGAHSQSAQRPRSTPHRARAFDARPSSTTVTADTIPLCLIEDNRLLRDCLMSICADHGLHVVATARCRGEAVRQVTSFKPDLVLVDAELGEDDSVQVVEEVRKVSPEIKVVVMHPGDDAENVVDHVRAGATGFILKDASDTEIATALRSVAEGEHVLPLRMTGALFSHVAARPAMSRRTGPDGAPHLTERQRGIVALIADGLSNKEIADRLNIAGHTVKSHVHQILVKLALHSRLAIAAFVHANGGLESAPMWR